MIYFLDLVGVAAFSISGVMASRSKRPDIIGAVVVAFVTALGGGVLRDVILGRPAVTFTNPLFFYIIFAAAVLAILIPKRIIKFNRILLIADAIGLGSFTAGAVITSIENGTIPHVFIITLTAITGCGGGVIRDTLLNEIPLILRKEIYLTACLAGAVCGLVIYEVSSSIQLTIISTTVITIAIRLLAIHFSWSLPLLRNTEGKKDNQ